MAEQFEIQFCALCNESVPQGDLAQGHAAIRKGRVICATCERSMSHAELEPAAVAAGAGSTSLPTPAPIAATPAPAGRGTGLVWVALLAVGGLAVYEAVERRKQATQWTSALEATSAAARSELAQTRGELARTREALEAAAGAQRESQAALQGSIAQIGGRVDELARARAEGDAAVSAQLAALDSRVAEGAQRTAEVGWLRDRDEHQQRELDKVLARVGELETLRAPPSDLPADPQVAARPPWMDAVDRLKSASMQDRWLAIQTLRETRDVRVAEYLHPLLSDPDVFLRTVVAQTLGDLGAQTSVGPLIGALEDQDAPVREQAFVSLRTITKRDLPFDAHADATERARRVKAWQEWWKKAREGGSSS